MRKLLLVALLAGFGAAGCSTTVAVAPTAKGTYRFYSEGGLFPGPNTKVQLCKVEGAAVSCKEVRITYE